MPEKCLEKNSKSLFLSSRFMTFRLLSLALSFLPSSDQFFQSDMVPPAEIMIGLLTPLWVGSFGLMFVRFAKYCFLCHTFSCHTPTRAGWIVLWLIFCFLIDPVMGVEPNVQKDYDTLPGVSMWNGIPFNTFRTAWWPTLVAKTERLVGHRAPRTELCCLGDRGAERLLRARAGAWPIEVAVPIPAAPAARGALPRPARPGPVPGRRGRGRRGVVLAGRPARRRGRFLRAAGPRVQRPCSLPGLDTRKHPMA